MNQETSFCLPRTTSVFRIRQLCRLLVLLGVIGASLGIAAETERVGFVPEKKQATVRLFEEQLQSVVAVPVIQMPQLDRSILALEDAQNEAQGLPVRFAIPVPTVLRPEDEGLWEVLDNGLSVWRMRFFAPDATSLNLGFRRFFMPEAGRLMIYAADNSHTVRPFTSRDNAEHGELWTPLIPSDEIVVEVTVPTSSRDRLDLELASVNVGYRDIGQALTPKSGACNVDVVCPQGNPWRDEISSVAVYSRGGSRLCSGAMVNNTALDQTPYFLTANHCGMTSQNAASMVVYWNFETSTCGGTPDGQLTQFQTGAFWRASYVPSDVTLVQLDEAPDPSWGVAFAGWDRSGNESPSAVGIHHPSTDEKRISFENDATTTTSYGGSQIPGNGTHVRITDWDVGTTEPGSSGSPLFNADHRVIGQLHGGGAACGNDLSDWYGKFSVSWDGGGSQLTRLRDWLDTNDTREITVDTLVPGATPPDPNEPNDDFGSATAIACPSFNSVNAKIEGLGDVDFYVVVGDPGSLAVIDVDAAELGSSLDPVLGAFDSSFAVLATSDDNPAPGEPLTLDPYLEVTVPANGVLYVAVTAFSDFDFNGGPEAQSTGSYDLSLTVPCPTDPNEPNNDFGSATPISCPSFDSVDAEILPLGDVDYYLLNGEPGALAFIDVDAAEFGSTLDGMLGAFDSSFATLATSDDNPAPGEPPTVDPYLEVVMPANGLLYIAVTSYSDVEFDGGPNAQTTGTYDLSVRVSCPPIDPNEPNDSFGSATPTSCPSFDTVGAQIAPLGDLDFYIVAGEPGTTAVIDIDAAEFGSTLDPLLGAFNSSFVNLVTSDDNPAPGEPFTLDSYLEVTMPADGLLFIVVTAYADSEFDGGGNALSTGFYDLSVTVPCPPGDPNEPNEDFASATAIACPSFVSQGAEISPSGDLDYFLVTGDPGSLAVIDVDAAELASALDPLLGVFDSSFALLATSDDDPAPGEEFSLDPYLEVIVPDDGLLYIALTAYADFDFDGGDDTFSTGFYELSVNVACPPLDPNEPNEDFGTAKPIFCPSFNSVDTQISPLGDVDYFLLRGEPGALTIIDLDAQEIGSSLDTLLGAFDSSFAQLAISDDDPAPGEPVTLDSYLEVVMPVNGLLYVAVTSFSDIEFDGGPNAQTSGFYNLSVTVPCPLDPNEPNDEFASAARLSCPSFDTENAQISPLGDVDFYRVEGEPGTLAIIDIDASELGTTLDSLLGVFDSSFVRLAISDDDPAPGEPFTLDSYLEVVIPADGRLFIAVTSFFDVDFDGGPDAATTGFYTLSVNLPCPVDPSEPNDNFAAATRVPCFGFTSADTHIAPRGDVDYYIVAGDPGTLATIDIDADELGSTLDPLLGVFDSSFGELAISDDNPAPGEPFTLDSYLEVIVPPDGVLYIAVTSFFDGEFDGGENAISSGSYRMSVAVSCPFDVNEPNGNFDLATPIFCPAFDSTNAEISPLGDVDYYLLSGAPGTLASIDIDAAESGSTLDSVLGAFDSSFAELAVSDDDPAPGEPPTLDSYLEVLMPADGLLYIAVTSFSDFEFDGGPNASSTGLYGLSVTVACPPDPFEPNDDFGTAAAIPCPSFHSVNTQIRDLGDVDYFVVAGEPGTLALIDVDAAQSGSALDSVLGAFDSAFVPLATSDDDPAPGEPLTLDSYLEVAVPADGLLYVAVASFSDFDFNGGPDAISTGFYDLSVTVACSPGEPNDDFGSATPIACPAFSSANTVIAPLGDLDYYALIGQPGTLAILDVDADEFGSSLDALLGAFDSSLGLLAASDDDPAPGEPFTVDPYLEVVMPADGLLFVVVTSFGDFEFDGGPNALTTGFYSLSAAVACPCVSDQECDDGDPCTQDTCEPSGSCLRVPLPDSDGDGFCEVIDTCPFRPNPLQGPVPFGQLVRAATSTDFAWPAAEPWFMSTGTFMGSVDLGVFDFTLSGVGTSFTDLGAPPPGSGFWYLVKPDCAASSYQTVLGSEPQRDALLP